MGDKAVTIHIASIGTPLAEGGHSTPGHMWFELHDEGQSKSYGFAPTEHGDPHGPGKIYYTDTSNYLDRKYMRTLELSDDQYQQMQNVAKNPEEFGFETYNGFYNSCVDFTWKALEEAGIRPRMYLVGPEYSTDGEILPGDNLGKVASIDGKDVPYPGKIDYMQKKGPFEKIWDKMTARGGSQQAELAAIGLVPGFYWSSNKRDSTIGLVTYQAMDNASNTAPHTFFNGKAAYLLAQTTQPTCQGDASGRGGGVRSGTIGKEVKPTSGSQSIFIAGKALVREGDSCTMNNANTTGKYILV